MECKRRTAAKREKETMVGRFSGVVKRKKLLPTCFADVVDALLREGRGGAALNGAGVPPTEPGDRVSSLPGPEYDSDDEGGRCKKKKIQ